MSRDTEQIHSRAKRSIHIFIALYADKYQYNRTLEYKLNAQAERLLLACHTSKQSISVQTLHRFLQDVYNGTLCEEEWST